MTSFSAFRTAAFAAALGCLAAPAALAQDATRSGTTFGDWVFTCRAVADGVTECSLNQTLVAGEQRQTVGRFTLSETTEGGVQLSALLPLGAALPRPATMQVDERDPQEMTWRTCVRGGCFAAIELSNADIAAMRSGSTLNVSFRNVARGDLTYAGSLTGITAALDSTGWGG